MQINTIRRHWPAAVAALVVALFTVAPQITLIVSAGSHFQGIYGAFNGDWLYYVARIRDVTEGHLTASNPYLFEHKTDPYPQASGGEMAVAGFSSLIRVDPVLVQVWLDFFGPLVIAALTYALLYHLSRSRWLSATAPVLLYVASGGLLKPINPEITFPLLLLFLIGWFSLLDRQQKGEKRIVPWIAWCGIALGLLFLTYFFHWSFLCVVIGTYGAFQLWQRKFKSFFHQTLIVGIAFMIGIPYFYSLMLYAKYPFSAETAVRVGAYHSHVPESLPRTAVAVLACAFFVLFIRKWKLWQDQRALGVLSILVANVIYPNHQVLSGLIIQNAVHWSFMPVFLTMIALAFAYPFVKNAAPSVRSRWLFGIGFVLLFLLPLIRLSSFLPSFSSTIEQSRSLAWQRYAPLVSFLNNTTPTDSVVFTNPTLSYFLPAYTHTNVFYAWYIFNMPASDQEVMDRYLLSHVFEPDFYKDPTLGIATGTQVLWTQPFQSEWNTHLIDRLRHVPYDYQYAPSREIAFATTELQRLRPRGLDLRALKSYRIDYIVWDSRAEPAWNLDQYPELQKIFENDELEVFSFR